MNNIYKVIWSKAKNCYVVASEIARSHTKSATGSGKIGGVTRRSLLASLMALSLLCGGLGVASAANGTVHVAESSASSDPAVYTTAKVDTLLEGKADKTELGNKADATAVAVNTEKIDTNKADINALQSELGNKADATALADYAKTADVNTALDKKADKATTLAGYEITDAYTKEKTDELLNTKANAADVYKRGDIDTKLADVYSKTEVDDKITGEENARNIAIQTAINGEAENRKNAIDVAIAQEVADRNQAIKIEVDKEANARNIAIANAKNDLQTKITEEKTARDAADKALDNRLTTAEGKITANETAIDKLKTKDTALEGKINTLDASSVKYDNATVKDRITLGLGGAGGTTITNLKDADLSDSSTDAVTGKQLNKTNEDLKTEAQTRAEMDTLLSNRADALEKNTGGITRSDAKDETYIEKNVTVDNQGNIEANGKVTANGVDAGAVNAGSLTVENASNLKGDVTMGKTLKVTGDTTLKKTDVDGTLNVTGESSLKDTQVNGTLTTTGKATFKEAVEMDKGLTVTSGDTTLQNTDVKGALNVTGESSLKNTEVKGTLGVTGATTLSGELTAKENATFEKDVTVEGTTNLKDTTVTGDLKVTGTITTDRMVFGDKVNNNYTEIDHGKVTSKNQLVVTGTAETISSSSTFNAKENKVGFANSATDEQSSHKQTSDVITDTVKNNNTGDQSFHKQTSDVIMDNVKDGKNSNNRTQTKTETKDIITDEKGNSSTTSQTASENKTYLKDKGGKNTNSTIDTAKGYDKTIKGENGKTSTKQDELNITNTAKDGTITNDAKNIVNNAATMDTTVTGKATESYGELETTVNGNETHKVTGNQENTIDGDQTTTVKGNVKKEYQKDLTTTVTGKVTENYNGGQETNVTGDQDIKVSGTQTTTATDINRNASSGMIDTIDNDYGTNTETKVAGKTTTDVSIKGTGEEGKYIRGANESRDYLIKGTLKNTETKTVEKTSTEITDGNGKTSATIQDVNNLAGSVTNGTETGVSGIHANDDGSVSIDSSVAGGGMSSVINQKKDSIQSAVGDGTSSTVILQDKDNVTIASSNGIVAIGGKDIVNNAQDTITNTAGTKITDTAGDSTVTTEKAKGTTFTKTGSTAYSTEAGAPTDTNIAGNHITTGRVDANELKASDKDDHGNTADLSVKAGEGVKASASNGTITGSLDVTADEVGSSVKDASGKGSTFKQRIDAIMMESKNVSITAEGTLTKEAKDIVTNASNSITEKVGDTNVTEKTTTSSKSEIQNADTITSVQQTENMVQSYVGKKDLSATNVTTNFANASANQVTENGQTSTVLNNKDGLLIQNNANGNSFTTADGTNTGPALEWTNIKGNEISTGKVEANYVKMGYADVMKDLGVRGNAKVGQNLEVGGTSTLKGDVTMGSNATVKNNLNVEGITTTKTLSVTENATVGGTLDVTGKATFKDSVSIAKDLSVGGDVTAKSYKVGGNTYIDANGIHANNQKITNVADGSISEGSKDAVNGGQLYGMKTDLEHKVDKVGANAAAMANLHPMEFDPDSKWNIAAAMGNYGSETATAIGAFYRPNEDVMVNFSTAFGTGENMVGGGVSVRLGKGSNKLSREESNALKAQVNDLTARMDALLSVLNPNMSKDFPDVPENHWAYEAVSRLAGNDIVQGYPDGEFHGDRTMTRYEMAEIIYNALSRGAEAEKELVEEFKPELQAMAASEKATVERAEG